MKRAPRILGSILVILITCAFQWQIGQRSFGAAPWGVNQAVHATSGGSGTASQNLPVFPKRLHNPSAVYVFATQYWGSANTYAIWPTDTASVLTFADCGMGFIRFGTNEVMQCFCAPNTSTALNDRIVVHSGHSAPFLGGVAIEVFGPANACVLDGGSGAGYNLQAGGSTGAAGANSLTVPSMTTVTSGDLILAVFLDQTAGVGSGTWSAGTSPVAFTSAEATFYGSEYYYQRTAGPIAATAGSTAPATYGAIEIAIKP